MWKHNTHIDSTILNVYLNIMKAKEDVHFENKLDVDKWLFWNPNPWNKIYHTYCKVVYK